MEPRKHQGGDAARVKGDYITRVADVASLTPSQIDEIADGVGETWKRIGIKTNQIRNIYGCISSARNAFASWRRGSKRKSLEDVKNMLVFLKPRLAYAAGRMTKIRESEMDRFYRSAINGLEKVPAEKLEGALDNFFRLSEAIVAYHKYHAG